MVDLVSDLVLLGTLAFRLMTFSFKVMQIVWSYLQSCLGLVFVLSDLAVGFCKFVLQYLPGALSALGWLANLFFTGLSKVFDFACVISTPIVGVMNYAIFYLLPSDVHEQVSFWASIVFSSVTLYVVSLILVVLGSLIIATEETIPGRNRFRPKTTVPLVCFFSGILMHYDTVRYSTWTGRCTHQMEADVIPRSEGTFVKITDALDLYVCSFV